jgi:hypothetical protein
MQRVAGKIQTGSVLRLKGGNYLLVQEGTSGPVGSVPPLGSGIISGVHLPGNRWSHDTAECGDEIFGSPKLNVRTFDFSTLQHSTAGWMTVRNFQVKLADVMEIVVEAPLAATPLASREPDCPDAASLPLSR